MFVKLQCFSQRDAGCHFPESRALQDHCSLPQRGVGETCRQTVSYNSHLKSSSGKNMSLEPAAWGHDPGAGLAPPATASARVLKLCKRIYHVVHHVMASIVSLGCHISLPPAGLRSWGSTKVLARCVSANCWACVITSPSHSVSCSLCVEI